MSNLIPLLPLRGNTAKVAAYTGPEGSVVVNTQTKTIHIQDGVTPGGQALSKVGHAHTLNELVAWLGYTPVNPNIIGANNGIAPLGADGKVPAEYISGGSGGSSNSLVGTGQIARSAATSGIYAGVDGSNPVIPTLTWTNAAAPVGSKVVQTGIDSDGSFWWAVVNDAINSQSKFQTVTRTNNTVNLITFTSQGFNFAGLSTGLRLNGQAGTAGQVLTSNGSAAAPTWQDAAGSPSGVITTVPIWNGQVVAQVANAGVQLGRNGGGSSGDPSILLTNTAAGAGSRLTRISTAANASDGTYGDFILEFANDGLTSATDFLRVYRSGETAAKFEITSTALNFIVGTGGLQLNGSAGAAGQVLTSNGAGAAPTWQAATATATTLTGTGASNPAGWSSAAGVYTSVNSGLPTFGMVRADAAANNRLYITEINNAGQLSWKLSNDAWSASTAFMTVSRSANTASLITFTGTAFNLAGLTAGLQLNGAAGTAGQVLTSNGNAAAPTWTTPAVSALNATSASLVTTASSGVYAGFAAGAYPYVRFVNSGLGTSEKALQIYADNTTGALQMGFLNDALNNQTIFMSVTRTGQAPNMMTFTAAGMNLAIGTSGLRLNGATGTAGQVLMSNGSAAAPTWGSPTVSTLSATAAIPTSTSVSGVYGGTLSGNSLLQFVNLSAAAGQRVWDVRVDTNGSFGIGLMTDAAASLQYGIRIDRSGQTLSNVVITGTAITLTGAVTGTSFAGNGAALTALNASNLSTGTVPTARLGSGTPSSDTYLRGDGTWAALNLNAGLITQIPRTTALDATSRGKRVIVTADTILPSGVFVEGDIITLYNSGTTDLQISPPSGTTLWLDGTNQSGTRMLAPHGTCSIWYNSATEAIISGSVV